MISGVERIKHIATSITIARIIGAGLLLLTEPLSALFFTVYLICGLSDIFDGYVARKTNTTSKLGTVLDSVADFIFVIVVLVLFVPILPFELWRIYWIAGIALIRCGALLIGFVKYHAFAFLHTRTNKVTGFALFCFPLLYHAVDLTSAELIVFSIASLSAIEELIINAKSKTLNRDVQSLFSKQAESTQS